jgi:hypothetical protein
MGVELTDEQKLDLVFFEVTHEAGRLAKIGASVESLKRAADWSWKRLAYEVAKNVTTVVVTSFIFAVVGLILLGARVQLVGAGTVIP